MFCSKCGSAVDNDAKFCGNCGASIIATAEIQQNETPSANSNNPLSSDQKNTGSGISGGMIFSLALVFVFVMLYLVGIVNESSKSSDNFKNTNAGKALYSCVSSSGKLTISDLKLDSDAVGVNVELTKNKTIKMQFSVDSELNQAKLIGAALPGEDKVSMLVLMLHLEAACGGQVSSQILPDEYNALRMMR